MKLIVYFSHYKGNLNFEFQRNFLAKTKLVALFEMQFRSLFFDE